MICINCVLPKPTKTVDPNMLPLVSMYMEASPKGDEIVDPLSRRAICFCGS